MFRAGATTLPGMWDHWHTINTSWPSSAMNGTNSSFTNLLFLWCTYHGILLATYGSQIPCFMNRSSKIRICFIKYLINSFSCCKDIFLYYWNICLWREWLLQMVRHFNNSYDNFNCMLIWCISTVVMIIFNCMLIQCISPVFVSMYLWNILVLYQSACFYKLIW